MWYQGEEGGAAYLIIRLTVFILGVQVELVDICGYEHCQQICKTLRKKLNRGENIPKKL